MESTRSKIAKFIISNTIKKQLSTQKLNLKMLRLIDIHEPPKLFFQNCNIKKIEIEGSTVHIAEPKNSDKKEILLYIHGGAFVSGPMRVHWHFLSKIAKKTGYQVAMVDYPKSPENDFRVVQKSVRAVYKYFIENYDASKMVMGGDSAGGNLTLTTALWAKEQGLPLPKKLLPLCPVTEMTMSNEEAWKIAETDPFLALEGIATCGKWYINGGNPLAPNFSPIYGELNGLPPIDIFCGTADMLYPDGKKFAQKAKESGVAVNYYEYPDMMHTWMFFPLPEAKKAFAEIVKALD